VLKFHLEFLINGGTIWVSKLGFKQDGRLVQIEDKGRQKIRKGFYLDTLYESPSKSFRKCISPTYLAPLEIEKGSSSFWNRRENQNIVSFYLFC
jgi:hypothetical protein